MDAHSRLAQSIALHIEDGALTELTMADLAERLRISERHLRRIVKTEFGVSPLELAQTQRLLLAKQLLTDTALPITEIAFASGFASVRRFNTIFKERYGMNPSQLRKRNHASLVDKAIVCDLGYRPPLDWNSLIDFLSARAIAGVESFVNGHYRRTVSLGSNRGWIEVAPHQSNSRVRVRISMSLSRAVLPILARVRRLFDLNAEPEMIADHLGSLATNRPGLRIPGAFDGFEIAVRAILGQQVSVKGATTLMSRLISTYGEPIDTPFEDIHRLSPSAAKLSHVEPAALATAVRIPQTRATAIVELARAADSQRIVLSCTPDVEATIKQLKELPGIGEWTAQYIAMRALNWPDAFLHADLGIKKALNETSAARILALAEKWRPWRAYAAMHLWKSLRDQN